MSSGKSAKSRKTSGKGNPRAAKTGRLVETLKQQATENVAEAARQARTQGEKFLSEQKERAAGGLQDIGRSIRSSAASLQSGPLGEIGDYVEVAAERLDQASQYLIEQDLQGLWKDVEAIARRQPAWFLGGMFVAGLALARFAKSTDAENGRRVRRS